MNDETTPLTSSPLSLNSVGHIQGESLGFGKILDDYEELNTKTSTVFDYILFAFSHMNTTVGAGIVMIPFAMQAAGIALAPILLVLIFMLSLYAMHLLLSCSESKRVYTYKDLAQDAYGYHTRHLFDFITIFFCEATITVYIAILASTVPHQIEYWMNEWHPFNDGRVITPLLMIFVIFPLSSISTIRWVDYVSFVNVISTAYLMISLIVKLILRAQSTGLPMEDIKYVNDNWKQIFYVFPIFAFAFGSHFTELPKYKKLESKTKASWIVTGMSVVHFLCYCVVGIIGYLLFMDKKLTGNILDIVAKDDAVFVVEKFIFFIVMILKIPPVVFYAREAIEDLFFAQYQPYLLRWVILTMITCGIPLAIGVFWHDIVTMLGFFVTTAGVMLLFVFPVAIYLKYETNWVKKTPALIMAITSVIVGVMTIGMTVWDLVEQSKKD